MADTLGIDGLAAVAGGYDAIFCDVWGVVHDGERKSHDAVAALTAARRAGLKVVLLTNSPRPADGVARQLDALHVGRDAYDAIVTSGDVTRRLIAEVGGPVFHLGPERDVDIFGGLDVERVPPAQSRAIVATGLFRDEEEEPADYTARLAEWRALDLPMICANPDIVVHRGERLIWCAGALARDYAALGGEVRMAGKPHRPIYVLAAETAGLAPDARILAIGDGLNTDIRGANDYGIDALLVVGGIHGEELGGRDAEAGELAGHLAERGLSARYFLYALR